MPTPSPTLRPSSRGIRELVENAEQIAEREAAEDAEYAAAADAREEDAAEPSDATAGEQVEEPQTDAVPGEGEA